MSKISSNKKNKRKITNNCHKNILINYSDIELPAIYSKNKDDLTIIKNFLKKNKKNLDKNKIDNIMHETVKYLRTTASIDAIKLFISFGANINFVSSDGYTAFTEYIFISALNSNDINIELDKKIIKSLIECGYDINKENKGLTSLTLSIRFSSDHERLEIIKLLISKGSNINYKNCQFETPLMSCFRNNHNKLIRYDIIKLLLDNKADVYIKNIHNKNIFDVIKNEIGEESDIYSLIFNYKNIRNEHFYEFDINFFYHNL